MWKVSDLAGSEVFDIDGQKLGVLVDVLPSGSNDIWVVMQNESKELLIPALFSVVKDVDIPKKKIKVDLPAGLKEIYETDKK
ncbi:MAG: PRC-barrel domain-containing protein [Elusimicrobia bacterium]|nr:PRC-barrel domain-containing protein [Candidatus Liberimonas magnetica]